MPAVESRERHIFPSMVEVFSLSFKHTMRPHLIKIIAVSLRASSSSYSTGCYEANVRAESSSRLGPSNRQLGKADSTPPTLSEPAWRPLNQEMAKGERGGDLELRFRELTARRHPPVTQLPSNFSLKFVRKTILTGINNKNSNPINTKMHFCSMQ